MIEFSANHPIRGVPVLADDGRQIGLEVTQPDNAGKPFCWTFSVCTIGPRSAKFPPHYIRGSVLMDTAADDEPCGCQEPCCPADIQREAGLAADLKREDGQ